ncbi:hypothetical protein MRB53_036664 [Persea americana]|nr:hypothetical protein MRB53_036664 [Persea americana]
MQAALFATTREAKDSRVKAENTCIDSGLMTRADDGSSGRSRMMRKSHVRFPEKGVATYWSFDQPPPSAQALFGPAQFSYPSVQCTGLISWREKPKLSCVVVVRRLDAFPYLPGIVPHRKKERGAPARPVGPLT